MRNSNLRPAQLTLLGIILLGWSLLSWHLGEPNLWIDEYNTFHMIQGSPQQVIRIAANDFHPPLYFLMLHFWAELAGTSDFSLRWPSIAASLLCLPLLAVLARRLADSRVALWSALLLCLAPAAIEFGRMARYYSLVMALGLLSTILLLIALQRGTWITWIAYALAALGLLYTFYPSGILLAGLAATPTGCRPALALHNIDGKPGLRALVFVGRSQPIGQNERRPLRRLVSQHRRACIRRHFNRLYIQCR